MPTTTTKFKFYKYNTTTDGDLKFNFNTGLNENWDRVETNVAITIYNNSTTYKRGDYVLSPNNFRIYYSIADNNLNNPISDTTKWLPLDTSPVGTIRYFAGSTAPNGNLICDGSAISRTTYAELYGVIGTTYGTGDGINTFNLPNLIDKFPQGSTTVGTNKDAGLPNLIGSFQGFTGGYSGIVSSLTAKDDAPSLVGGNENYPRTVNIDASVYNSIYGNSTTVQPPALTLLPIIRY